MKIFVKRHGLYEISKSALTVELPEGAALCRLISELALIDGCNPAEKSDIETLYLRDQNLIKPETVLYDGDTLTVLTPLRDG